ncbi:cyclin dependent kinase inhibitor 1Bb [Chanos chanos]|uniref:Cyclin-dependent kinase inhibitor 1B n=1 Tax=Chanos chanos TaxID=29144 RepID=A0A6J2V3B3_CHACN|nr:cyclin-dependent kinase inhibitor 1B [Chanos chanos]
MSDVRLSNGSPTLERMEARLSDHPKPSACRMLFGPVDHEELKRDLKGHLQEMAEASLERWNFDFLSHKPIQNGRFEWEEVDCNSIPNFYSGSELEGKGICTSGNNNVDLNGNHNCVVVAPSRLTETNAENCESQMDCRDPCFGQRKRPACHDSSSQTKRSHTSLDEVTCCSDLTHMVEHTPRKSSPPTQT